jgi:hypothetical protein
MDVNLLRQVVYQGLREDKIRRCANSAHRSA